MGTKQKLAALAAVGITGLGGLALQVGTSGAASSIARAELRDASGNVVGEVVFKRREGEIVGQAEVQLPAGGSEFRSFHIHANADGAGCVAPAFTSVGGHWDVGGHNHGAHTGDLPVLMGDAGGHAESEFVIGKFEPSDIIGRAVIVHVLADSYANINTRYVSPASPPGGGADPTTLANGDAGGRFACGVIEPRSG